MKPYKFKPYLKMTLWGGQKIAAYKGIETNLPNIGESWEISGMPGHESVTVERGIPNDPDLGLTLTQLIERHGATLVGKSVYERFGNHFPLLVKFIDSSKDLSLQVHPNDQLAQERHQCFGKSEVWYIIDAEPGAQIYAGLRQPLTPEEYLRLATEEPTSDGTQLMDWVTSTPSQPGDFFYLPAGCLHAIGAGNFLAEIQQASDITYRVHDFGRRDSDGNLRELHVALAKDAINYDSSLCCLQEYDRTQANSELIRCPYFHVHRLAVDGEVLQDVSHDSFVIVLCLRGEATVNGVAVRQGESLLVPACADQLHVTGKGIFLTATA